MAQDMVSMLDSGSSRLGLSPGHSHCVVFLGKTLSSQCKVPLSTQVVINKFAGGDL